MPEISWRKNESTPRTAAGRASTRPTVAAPSPDRARAAVLGRQPSCSATRRIRSRVTSETPGRPLSAKDTALSDTPARWAMSFMVGRRAGVRRAAVVSLTDGRFAATRAPLFLYSFCFPCVSRTFPMRSIRASWGLSTVPGEPRTARTNALEPRHSKAH